MATITKKGLRNSSQFGGVPYGNLTVHQMTLATLSTGAVDGSDSTAAVGIGDVVRFGFLPKGFRIDDALLIVSDLITASETAKIGFAYVDGVDDTTVPQDDDYFLVAGTALSALGRTRANNTAVKPETLPKDVYVILTNAGAAAAAVGRLDLLVYGVDRGPI